MDTAFVHHSPDVQFNSGNATLVPDVLIKYVYINIHIYMTPLFYLYMNLNRKTVLANLPRRCPTLAILWMPNGPTH